MNFKIENNEIYFTRQGEVARLSVCGENSIRFQASPNCRIEDVNWTLIPQNAKTCAHIENNRAVLETGDMCAEIYHSGKVIYYYRGRKIIEEKPEFTFDAQIRNYRNIASNLWKARVTFEPNKTNPFTDLDMRQRAALI